jgi:succinate dehydrogenase / fumarate reductase cytochrome b subunit
MAVTGLVLVLFVTGHMVGNLQLFAHPDKLNGYAHFLQSLGPALWVVRFTMLACAVIHVWAAVTLYFESQAARGPEAYGVRKWLKAAVASRYMRHSGIIVGVFIVYHILHFTVGTAQHATFKTQFAEYQMAGSFHLLGLPIVDAGAKVHDVWSMVYLGFSCPIVAIFYIVAVGLLTIHLWHGADSMFQTVGFRNERWSACLRRAVGLFCLVYFLGSAAVPGAVLVKAICPPEGTAAAKLVCKDGSCCINPETKK